MIVGILTTFHTKYTWDKSTFIFYLNFILLMWRIGRAPNSIPLYSYIQQVATSHNLFISGNLENLEN
jgi:hypothetical protein